MPPLQGSAGHRWSCSKAKKRGDEPQRNGTVTSPDTSSGAAGGSPRKMAAFSSPKHVPLLILPGKKKSPTLLRAKPSWLSAASSITHKHTSASDWSKKKKKVFHWSEMNTCADETASATRRHDLKAVIKEKHLKDQWNQRFEETH